jgi:hypothetical protein
VLPCAACTVEESSAKAEISLIAGAQATGIRREASVILSKKGRLRPFAEVPKGNLDNLCTEIFKIGCKIVA